MTVSEWQETPASDPIACTPLTWNLRRPPLTAHGPRVGGREDPMAEKIRKCERPQSLLDEDGGMADVVGG